MIDLRRIRRSVVTVSLGARANTDARRTDPKERRKGERRRAPGATRWPLLLVVLALIFTTGSAAALFASGGLFERRRLESVQAAANVELERQLLRVHELSRDVDRLSRDALARERLAREELGYSREGELIFLLAEPAPRP